MAVRTLARIGAANAFGVLRHNKRFSLTDGSPMKVYKPKFALTGGALTGMIYRHEVSGHLS